MEFRSPVVASEKNKTSCEYLTKYLKKPEAGVAVFNKLLEKLGNTIDDYPDWHPVVSAPAHENYQRYTNLHSLSAFKGIDHTIKFVRGFVTCPYSKETADGLIDSVNRIPELRAYSLQNPLYSDRAYPVVIEASEVMLEPDGTIRSRDALIWYTQTMVRFANYAECAETWWNIRGEILGFPHGARSSLLVNQNTGSHMRKILEVLNNSGIYGSIKENSLEMLSGKKRKLISETLLTAAIEKYKNTTSEFEFEMRGEICKAKISDTWKDGFEIRIKIMIGDFDLYTSGYYYPKEKRLEASDPRGKSKLAEKFL